MIMLRVLPWEFQQHFGKLRRQGTPATANVQLSDFMFKLKQLFSSRPILGNTGTSAVFGNDHGTATGKTGYMVDFSMAN